MTLISPHKSRERILIYGGGGSGKSSAALSIARNVKGTVFVVDNDFAWDRMLETNDPGNVDVRPSFMDDLDEYVAELWQVCEDGGRDDWMVLDSISPAWPLAQEDYINKVYDTEVVEYTLDKRKENLAANKPRMGALDGITDWPLVTKNHGRVYRQIMRFPGHVLITAEAKQFMSAGDIQEKPETIEMFGEIGAKPAGQNRLPYIPHTILYAVHRQGGWAMTTVKDRERDEWDNETVEDFAADYLTGVAGWKPARRRRRQTEVESE